MAREVTVKEWNRFVREGMAVDADTNMKFDFRRTCQQFGPAYFEYLKAAYEARDEMTDEEFMRINCVDPAFFAKNKGKLF